MLRVATELVGERSRKYVPGRPELGESPESGFDCSGLVTFVLKSVGLYIPNFIGMDGRLRPIRHASEFWDHYGVAVHSPLPGDLLFFSSNGNLPSHVGIVRDEETYIHAPGKDETWVTVATIRSETIALRGLGRTLYTRNPIGFKTPTMPANQPTYRYHQRIIE